MCHQSGLENGEALLRDGLGVVAAHLLEIRIRIPQPGSRKNPVQVRMGEVSRIPARRAFSARRAFALAEEHLREPESQTLFADPPGALQEQTGGQCARAPAGSQLLAERLVSIKIYYRHNEIMLREGHLGVVLPPFSSPD